MSKVNNKDTTTTPLALLLALNTYLTTGFLSIAIGNNNDRKRETQDSNTSLLRGLFRTELNIYDGVFFFLRQYLTASSRLRFSQKWSIKGISQDLKYTSVIYLLFPILWSQHCLKWVFAIKRSFRTTVNHHSFISVIYRKPQRCRFWG